MRTLLRNTFFLGLMFLVFSGAHIAQTYDKEKQYFSISKFKDLKKEIENLNLSKKDLVIFGVDMLLTMPRDPLLQTSTLETYETDFRRHLKSMSLKQREIAALYHLLKSPQQPTHDKMPNLVKYTAKKAKQIYLTDLLTGSFPRISSAFDWRIFSLGSAGYSIDPDDKGTKIYKEFPKYLGSYPMSLGNFFMTNGSKSGTSKGDLLIRYLQEWHFSPSRIIMIDNRLSYLDSTRDHLKEHYPGIKFIGLHYTDAYNKQPIPPGYGKPTRKALKKALRQLRKLAQKAAKPYKDK